MYERISNFFCKSLLKQFILPREAVLLVLDTYVFVYLNFKYVFNAKYKISCQ